MGEIRNLLALYGREILDRLAIRAGYVPGHWWHHADKSLTILRAQNAAMRRGGVAAREKARRLKANIGALKADMDQASKAIFAAESMAAHHAKRAEDAERGMVAADLAAAKAERRLRAVPDLDVSRRPLSAVLSAALKAGATIYLSDGAVIEAALAGWVYRTMTDVPRCDEPMSQEAVIDTMLARGVRFVHMNE